MAQREDFAARALLARERIVGGHLAGRQSCAAPCRRRCRRAAPCRRTARRWSCRSCRPCRTRCASRSCCRTRPRTAPPPSSSLLPTSLPRMSVTMLSRRIGGFASAGGGVPRLVEGEVHEPVLGELRMQHDVVQAAVAIREAAAAERPRPASASSVDGLVPRPADVANHAKRGTPFGNQRVSGRQQRQPRTDDSTLLPRRRHESCVVQPCRKRRSSR